MAELSRPAVAAARLGSGTCSEGRDPGRLAARNPPINGGRCRPGRNEQILLLS